MGSGNVVGVRGVVLLSVYLEANLTGVKGISIAPGGSGGYGGDFEGELAPIWLRPSKTEGSPSTGAHNMGELYVDNQGALYFCVAGGTPGTWKTVQACIKPRRQQLRSAVWPAHRCRRTVATVR